jgi:alanyl-tRNA synthetase
MQHHLGQHILSGCFSELFSANTLKCDFGEGHFSITIDKALGEDEIKKAESLANKIIHENIIVETLYPTNSELKKMPVKKNQTKPNEKIRIIKIEDIVLAQCDMIHPDSTIEVQLIKITKWSKNEKGTKIEFICGSKAVADYYNWFDSIEKMSAALRCSKNDLLSEFQRLSEELKRAESEKRSLKSEVAEYEVQNMLNSSELIKDVRVIRTVFNDADLKYINLLATRLTSHPNVVVLFGSISQDKAQLVFMRSKELKIVSMNTLLKDAITLIDGKGGGSDFSAQGGGKNNNNLDSTIEYAYKKVNESIMIK